MYMLKLLFQKLLIRPILAPRKTADLLGYCRQVEASGPLCSGERQMTTCPREQLTAQDRNVASSFT